jgi:hypothetical protein
MTVKVKEYSEVVNMVRCFPPPKPQLEEERVEKVKDLSEGKDEMECLLLQSSHSLLRPLQRVWEEG